MKRTLSILIALLLCLFVFIGCDNVLFPLDDSQTTNDTVDTGAECKHNWVLVSSSEEKYECAECKETHLCGNPKNFEKAGRLNESTLIYKCKICGSEHLTTDPDSINPDRCESPDDHNWQIVSQENGCWYSIVYYACSKCDMAQTAEADLALPNHIWEESTVDGKTTFCCTRCNDSHTIMSEIREFSYAQALEDYKVGDPGVKHENFNNPAIESEIKSAIDVITRAEFELTIEYDTISVAYDEPSDMWRVDFWTLDLDGNSQSVYINGNGLTCYIVYGE